MKIYFHYFSFTNIVCRWPGATHDAFMLSNSTIGTKLEQNPVDGWLLGDSGYACRPWLLTPLSNPQTPPEEKYNRAHCRTRNTVERAFGVLKSRFRCLGKTTGCLMFTSKRCHQVVYAAAQLHNMCLDMNIPLPPSQADEVASDDTVYHGPICDGFQTRRGVIRQLFSRQ
ncbi:putative nuclease HARBI1 [Haliotis rufescens]|uniref:putative nuclease HARBI1 n=1 Tax=Haliotis rufescens TaxID=6454 RepID=UPI001EB0115E|nr:putative nuclease HARBI1 [Haliotis rufescens]